MTVLKKTFETEVGCNDLSPSDEEDIYIKDIEERFDGRNIEVKQIGGEITPPKTIYLQVCGTCQDNECDKCDFDQLSEVTWCKDRIHDNDVAYFSEDAIREAAFDMLNTSWADTNFDKAIDYLIERLKNN